jgi:succinate dehydrogenase/fumarate reductase flavoprotein subunit
VQVWLTSVFSLLAAIVGGWIAGRYAVHAQKHAAKEQRQNDLEAECRAVNGTLQAIKPELEVFDTELVGELKRKFEFRLAHNTFAMGTTFSAWAGGKMLKYRSASSGVTSSR